MLTVVMWFLLHTRFGGHLSLPHSPGTVRRSKEMLVFLRAGSYSVLGETLQTEKVEGFEGRLFMHGTGVGLLKMLIKALYYPNK